MACIYGGDGIRTEPLMETSTPGQIATDETADVLDDVRLGAFVREHYERLTGLARLVCRDSSEASDAVQAGLERAWRRRADLRDPAALRPWLDRIVVREALQVDRRRRSIIGRWFSGPREIDVDIEDPRASGSDDMADLRTAWADLPAVQRAALALHLYVGYSVAETADIVDAPIETVRSRLRLGRERLRAALGDER